jgi:catechol 2,3-dioxygenase-like lactoylglutathione lyase family enzyme
MMRRRGPAPTQDSAAELIGVDHVYLTVSDFASSCRFYDRLMRALGFKKGTAAIRGEPHCHYYNRSFQVSIRPAHHPAVKHDSYAPGLHHLSLRVADRAGVDQVARKLRALRIKVEGPRLWPEYSPDYYAVFFNDPDGIRLEVMNYLERRKLVPRVWNELEGFTNPLDRMMRRRARRAR